MMGGCCQVNAESQLIAGLAIGSQTILRTKVPLRKTLEPPICIPENNATLSGRVQFTVIAKNICIQADRLLKATGS